MTNNGRFEERDVMMERYSRGFRLSWSHDTMPPFIRSCRPAYCTCARESRGGSGMSTRRPPTAASCTFRQRRR
jgi:hypothetical protein